MLLRFLVLYAIFVTKITPLIIKGLSRSSLGIEELLPLTRIKEDIARIFSISLNYHI